MNRVPITRSRHRLLPDRRRVLIKPYVPGEETILPGLSRASLLIERILAIPERELEDLNAEIFERFGGRHRQFRAVLERQFDAVAHHLADAASLSAGRRQLIGAYFTHEYAVEAAALFNPSIVPAPDQSGVGNGALRFVMSVRAVGEGHLSSIEFRTGEIGADGEVSIDDPGTCLVGGVRTPPEHFDRAHFHAKLQELDAINELSTGVLERLGAQFTPAELEASLEALEQHGPPQAVSFETLKMIRVLASSNYLTAFPPDSALGERVLFPAGPYETRGMEDARFVRFAAADDTWKYYATYTAYDGFSILPQLIETADFRRFRVSTLHGAAAQNKGMALFPRRVDGRYVMLSRKDRENLYLATSTDVHNWSDADELYRPRRPWELTQIGNCGSPIETEAGWLVLTHGVGPMRRYAIGALLLDLDDPARVIGDLHEPLLEPDEDEREGYVPNVVYTCGAIVHGSQLCVPYGFADSGVAIAQMQLADLLDVLLTTPRRSRPKVTSNA